MTDLTARARLDAIHEGLVETTLLVALGYDATQGRPGRHLLNNALERRGYGRPIDEAGQERLRPYEPYSDECIRAIAKAVAGSSDAPLREVTAILRHGTANPTAA